MNLPAFRLLARAMLLGGAIGAAASAQSAPTACGAQEETLFSCSTGKKRLAVCASRGWSADKGSLQYRYGPPGAPELVLPAPGSTPADSAQSNVFPLSGGGGATLRFSAGDTDYVVYTAISASLGDLGGVAVWRNGQQLAATRCRGDVQSELGPELFKRGGFRQDAEPFVLP